MSLRRRTMGQSGGQAIEDGIVFKTRNDLGFPTEIDVYGETYPFQFSYSGSYYHDTIGWRAVDKVNLKTSQTLLKESMFAYLGLTRITGTESVVKTEYGVFGNCSRLTNVDFLPNMRESGNNLFAYCESLVSAYLPSLTHINGATYYSLFLGCTALESVQIGSVGHGVTYIVNGFRGCTQSGLTITVYTTGSYTDTVVSNIRIGATAATIIIKASEDTTYNGQSFAAGETILTSTP